MSLCADEWGAELTASLGYVVRVEFSRSRSTPIELRHARPEEVREEPGLAQGWVVRLHQVFADAPPEIRSDLASWIRVGRRARRASRDLGAWMEQAIEDLPPRPPRRTKLQGIGHEHDLNTLAESLLRTEFESDFDDSHPPPRVTWGRRGKSKARGQLQLGSFNPTTGIVRVHPVLDQEAVPSWLVRYVLFHEFLHAASPSERDSAGRVRHHGPHFSAREKAYPDYKRAVEWEKANLSKLLRSARAGRPLGTKKAITAFFSPMLPFGRQRD